MTPAAPLDVGQEAPDFELRDQHGQHHRLSRYRGSKVVALMFYPYAFSRVCTGEFWSIRDEHPELTSDDVQLLAISCDAMFSLRAFAERERLTFPLLSDFWPHGQVAASYGAFDAERGCAKRSTYVIDLEGTVRWAVHNATPEPRDLDEQARVLRNLTGPPK